MDNTHQTHINVFIEGFEAAYKEALSAVDTFKGKADALKVKYESLLGTISAKVEPEVAIVDNELKKIEKKPK